MKIEKVKKLVLNLYNELNMLYTQKNLNQALKHVLVFKKVHRVIKFHQNAWLKPYIDINTDLRKKQKLILK